jgi:hypothetical protein
MERQLTSTEQNALEKLTDEGRMLFFGYFDRDKKNPHLEHLITTLALDNPSMLDVFEYGLSHLPNEEERPNNLLASFFFFISEIKALSPEARSVAMDCMVYCETDVDDGITKRETLEKSYKKIKPLLS